VTIATVINLTPATLLDPGFEARVFAGRVEAAGLRPRQITLECTEQAASAVVPLKRQVKALPRRASDLRSTTRAPATRAPATRASP
jgi:sensor c-di-GMP phosphodiesterase-like protein